MEQSSDKSLQKVRQEEIIAKLEEPYIRIANEFGIPVGAVRIIAYAKYKRVSDKRLLRLEQIIKLQRQGHSKTEISAKLKISLSAVYRVVGKLMAEGVALPKPKKTILADLESERVQTIIALKKRGALLKEIGNALGVSTQRARQLISRIMKLHGKEVFKPDKPLWTTHQAAKEIGVNVNLVWTLCRNAEIPCQRRTSLPRSWYLLDENGIEALKKHPRITRLRICRICGKSFIYKLDYSRRQVCSDECLKQYNINQRIARLKQKPTLESLKGWRRELWQRLQHHTIPENEKWLTIGQAAGLVGLSKVQLWWLSRRNIVFSRPHPERKWQNKQPVQLYAASEMEIVRQVYNQSKQ